MKLTKFILLFITLSLISCKKDDDDIDTVPLRNEKEVAQENLQQIEDFLGSHFMKMVDNPSNSNYKRIEFDTLAGENAGETSLMDSPYLKTKMVKTDSVNYKLYYLQIRKGAPSEYQPKFADRVVITYKGESLTGQVFDETVNPIGVNLVTSSGTSAFITGFTEGLTEFKGASGAEENTDGTLTFNDDFGVGAVFIPSGLAYFNSSTPVGAYQPLIFTFQMYKGVQRDTDNDGIPSYMEDLNGNGYLLDEDTDGDQVPNFADADDDGDGTPTSEEIEVNDTNNDGVITPDEITLTDTDNDGTPDYLDPAIY